MVMEYIVGVRLLWGSYYCVDEAWEYGLRILWSGCMWPSAEVYRCRRAYIDNSIMVDSFLQTQAEVR